MGRSQPPLPNPREDPRGQSVPRVGRVSEFIGGRLLLIGLIAGVIGFVLLIVGGIKLWLVVTRGRLGADVASLVVFGALAFALLSIGTSARRTGLKYLRGERAVSRDLARFVARRLERRRQARGR
ncbi:MAG TPA: hypothetical protein VGL18_03995 [Actinomycetota bacterium]